MSPKVPPRLPPLLGAVAHVPPRAAPTGPKAPAPGVRRRPRAGERPEERASGQGAEADAFEHPERDPRDDAHPSAAQRQAGGSGGQAALAAPTARTLAPTPSTRSAQGVPPPPAFVASPEGGAAAAAGAQGATRPRRPHAELNALARAVIARYEQAPAVLRAQAEALLRRLP